MASSASENRLVLSKIATNGKHGENSPYFDGWKVYDQNPYHLTEIPEGVIQMGFAETQLPFDLVEEWIKKYPKALFALLKELRSSETWPIFKTTMASQSSDRYFDNYIPC
ncbi:1-aminocyclopropane-1-carboxylate synthase 1-like [Pyrus ussuriensis x Pyrus communis]|uniref:1-aminocyclopropane-1-carboxylate synthase 1-like n=1 Tax=Pyrus ussuriensis x Pyrus communis TaxID=2448454 RepID=A0A5N5G8E6_9ROSA|nr:1-aminocyclopropane-1-carboxylate synthase 1-like [Pyrus ussuriensis x Pyrus communis]